LGGIFGGFGVIRTSEDEEGSPWIVWSQGEKALFVVQRFSALVVPYLGEDRKNNTFPNTADWRSSITESVFPLETSKY